MGMGRDLLNDPEPWPDEPSINRRSRWTCSDGRRTCAAQMDTSHLINCISWINRQPDMVVVQEIHDEFYGQDWEKDGFSKAEWIECFAKELKRRSLSPCLVVNSLAVAQPPASARIRGSEGSVKKKPLTKPRTRGRSAAKKARGRA